MWRRGSIVLPFEHVDWGSPDMQLGGESTQDERNEIVFLGIGSGLMFQLKVIDWKRRVLVPESTPSPAAKRLADRGRHGHKRVTRAILEHPLTCFTWNGA